MRENSRVFLLLIGLAAVVACTVHFTQTIEIHESSGPVGPGTGSGTGEEIGPRIIQTQGAASTGGVDLDLPRAGN